MDQVSNSQPQMPASGQGTSAPGDTTVVVALSGGVDSATAAAVLVEQGYRVIGMTLRLYDAGGTKASSGGRCCGPRDIEDARRVCAHLDIPFYVVDLADEFQTRVMDDFVDAYLDGRTPNPCARCNQHIKFTPLLERARALGADRMATGHYARLERDEHGQVALRRGVDLGKDQSYFLFAMPGAELESILFPLGGLDKDEVRQRAEGFGLPNAQKPESQEICFVPDGDYAGFVEKAALVRGKPMPSEGPVVHTDGRELGRHQGTHRFTIGQRRGLGFAGPGGVPLYVTGIDRARNAVIVGDREHAETRTFAVADTGWLVGDLPESFECLAQVRHRQTPMAARVERGPRGVNVTLERATVAAPGQAAVFYRDDRVLGGGWIARSGV